MEIPTYNIEIASPLGPVCITSSSKGLLSVQLNQKAPEKSSTNEHCDLAAKELSEYFEGTRKGFNVAFDLDNNTQFYQEVWKYLNSIPFGETRSYLDIANHLGDPNSVRAVGMANGKNPIAIIIPCHRVIGSNGKLVGYAGGLDAKRWLLEHELTYRTKPNHLLF